MSSRRSRGFTLLELVLAMVIMGVGMLGIMSLFQNASRGALQADLNGEAIGLAREKLEEIIMDKVRDGYDALDESSYPQETFTGDFSPFLRITSIEEVAGSDFSTPQPGSGYKRIEVTVSWGTGPSTSISVPTVVARY